MQGARYFIMYFQISRCISSSSICSNLNREAKFMKKMIGGSRKSKKNWYNSSTELRSVSINPSNNSPSICTKRRMAIRDKLFMEHITDIMSMGQVSDIIKEAVEITHVKITADFKYVNVFYISSNNDVSLDQEALQRCAGIIRHELSQLRVIGVVPPIQFVQNKQYFIAKEVEKRLLTINFEGDTETSEQVELNVNNVNQISKLTTNCDFKADESCIQLPMMRHDVLGLNHHRIMSQIISAVSKSKKAAQRRILDANILNECDNTADKNSHDPVSKEAVEFVTRKEQQKILSDFLIQRRREEQRRYKLKPSIKQEMLNNFEEEIDNEDVYVDINEGIDNTYIDDFEDEIKE